MGPWDGLPKKEDTTLVIGHGRHNMHTMTYTALSYKAYLNIRQNLTNKNEQLIKLDITTSLQKPTWYSVIET